MLYRWHRPVVPSNPAPSQRVPPGHAIFSLFSAASGTINSRISRAIRELPAGPTSRVVATKTANPAEFIDGAGRVRRESQVNTVRSKTPEGVPRRDPVAIIGRPARKGKVPRRRRSPSEVGRVPSRLIWIISRLRRRIRGLHFPISNARTASPATSKTHHLLFCIQVYVAPSEAIPR